MRLVTCYKMKLIWWYWNLVLTIFRVTLDPHGLSQNTYKYYKHSTSSIWFLITILNTLSFILKWDDFVNIYSLS